MEWSGMNGEGAMRMVFLYGKNLKFAWDRSLYEIKVFGSVSWYEKISNLHEDMMGANGLEWDGMWISTRKGAMGIDMLVWQNLNLHGIGVQWVGMREKL